MKAVKSLEAKGIVTYDPFKYIITNKEEYKQYKIQLDRLLIQRKSIKGINLEIINKFKIRRSYLEEAENLKIKIDSMQHLVNQNDLDAMDSVLVRLGFIDKDGNVLIKGRVAASINTANEIVITELLLDGFFNELDPQTCAALLTVFVSEPEQQSSKENLDIPDEMIQSWTQIQKVIQNIATISLECGVDIDVEKFKSEFSPSFINIALQWTSGVYFAELMQSHSNEFEGSIIRTMKRLDELLNQMARASTIVNNNQHTELEEKFIEASKLIKRGIIFAASLYL